MTIPLAERFRDRLPFTESTPVVSLGEGSTPLLPAPRLSERLGVELWLKWEGANPTGSFKDRGMTVAVSKAVEAGARAVVCASTGNTAASAATYAARAGITAVILQPAGAVARGGSGGVVVWPAVCLMTFRKSSFMSSPQPGYALRSSNTDNPSENHRGTLFSVI